MAEAIGLASGILTLALFAFQASVSLRQVVDSFQSNKKVIRELKEELEALNGVLKSLQQAAATSSVDLSGLNLPLFRCGKACKDFEEVIFKCTAHSGGSRTSFRDWAMLKYMGQDISAFKDMLGGYKSTINIALADANLRTAAVTTTVLQEYKELIANTRTDLEDHLKEIDAKLQELSPQGSVMSNDDVAERERIQEERDSTKQCLAICALVSEHIDQVRPIAFKNISTAPDTYQARLRGLISAKQVTANVLEEVKARLTGTTADLEKHLQEIENKHKVISVTGVRVSEEDAAERRRIQEEKESIERCLSICDDASQQAKDHRTNVFGDVSAGEDGHQVIVATLGDLILANQVTVGDRGAQWLGQMSDTSLQHLSNTRAIEKSNGAAAGKTTDLPSETAESPAETDTKVRGHYYGTGYKLT